MTRDLSRLLNPKSVAVIGGGAWCAAVILQLEKIGYAGEIWPIHPVKDTILGRKAYRGVPDLPGVPDAAFVGINRDATIGAVERLRRAGTGGAVCFASGFDEVADGGDLHDRLLKAAGEMPVLGPNCYGLINALDGAALWPDQHGLIACDRGVAILTQSSNIAINLTMQTRGLPISHVITCGNQAQTTQAQIAASLLDDPRVTAIGLHIEGFGDPHDWEVLARKARARNIPIVALKVGRSAEAQASTVSHTASLAGQDAASAALLARLGIARVDDLGTLIEALKLLHVTGPLPHGDIATISCSGGEAALAADLAQRHGLRFPPLKPQQKKALSAALGPKVALANPLDYHTYIWRDTNAMTAAFSAMLDTDLALTMLIVDFPRADRCDVADWDCAIDAAKATRAQGGLPVAMIATLPELMPEAVATDLMQAGLVPLNGLDTAMAAVAAAVQRGAPDLELDLCRHNALGGNVLTEHAAKSALAAYGVPIPNGTTALDQVDTLSAPLVLKGSGFAHKTDHGAVKLHLTHADVPDAATQMNAPGYLVEEMVTDGVAELLVGITADPTCGFLMTLGAGGTLTELLDDTVHLLLPTSENSVKQALTRLKTSKLLAGYRGKPAADHAAIVAAIMAIQDYVLAHADTIAEVEVNPLICTPTRAVAADALIRKADD
ncbi:acetate--CoA ligase family protein [Yoonia sp. R2331]|uniref:acetate--CoA ligase family protein n=1 Tax=Yoonia sp. R2331 TaxID=3237238 RepID=UPI0034E4E5E6